MDKSDGGGRKRLARLDGPGSVASCHMTMAAAMACMLSMSRRTMAGEGGLVRMKAAAKKVRTRSPTQRTS